MNIPTSDDVRKLEGRSTSSRSVEGLSKKIAELQKQEAAGAIADAGALTAFAVRGAGLMSRDRRARLAGLGHAIGRDHVASVRQSEAPTRPRHAVDVRDAVLRHRRDASTWA